MNDSVKSTFEIRTLRDILELPTYEQMETCLDELAAAMKLARASSDLMIGIAETVPDAAGSFSAEWPEMVEWKDDGKRKIAAVFMADDKPFFEVRSQMPSPNPVNPS